MKPRPHADPLVRVPRTGSDQLAAAIIAVLLVSAWSVSYLMGGAGSSPPHLFYLPIVVAGLRFGRWWALLVAVVATAMAGPLLPSDVTEGTAQQASDWAWRGVFFAGLSLAMIQILPAPARSVRRKLRTHAMRQALTRAVKRNELVLHFQPLVTMREREIAGAEALVRWRHPELGLLGPSEFIPFAEQHGLIDLIGDWVIGEAARRLAEWNQAILPPDGEVFMTVNVSGHQLRGDHLAAAIDRALTETGLDPALLVLEITETALLEDLDASVSCLRALRERGVTTAVDDFGTGQSSLLHLRALDIDVVKIDRTFVENLVSNPIDQAIVEAVIQLSHRIEKVVIAEGVETLHQYEALVRLGCEIGQGYFFGRPLPAHEFAVLLSEDIQRIRARHMLRIVSGEAHDQLVVPSVVGHEGTHSRGAARVTSRGGSVGVSAQVAGERLGCS